LTSSMAAVHLSFHSLSNTRLLYFGTFGDQLFNFLVFSI